MQQQGNGCSTSLLALLSTGVFHLFSYPWNIRDFSATQTDGYPNNYSIIKGLDALCQYFPRALICGSSELHQTAQQLLNLETVFREFWVDGEEYRDTSHTNVVDSPKAFLPHHYYISGLKLCQQSPLWGIVLDSVPAELLFSDRKKPSCSPKRWENPTGTHFSSTSLQHICHRSMHFQYWNWQFRSCKLTGTDDVENRKTE